MLCDRSELLLLIIRDVLSASEDVPVTAYPILDINVATDVNAVKAPTRGFVSAGLLLPLIDADVVSAVVVAVAVGAAR
jgi:hypothetical protein